MKNNTNNKFYWYVSAIDKSTDKRVIGVAEGVNQRGLFTDLLNKPLIVVDNCGVCDINPTVIFDDAKQPFLTWGKSQLWHVKLNEDMVSYDKATGIQKIPSDKENWFVSKINDADNNNGKRHTTYEEGPWIYKRNNLYYNFYAAGGVPEHLAYSTSKSLSNPQWIYGDTIMEVITNRGAFTNHPGVVDFKGKTYLFYHNAGLPGGGGFTRSVCVDELKFNPDGSIPRIVPTKEGVQKNGPNINPFKRVEAETIAWSEGLTTANNNTTGIYVTNINNNNYIKVRSVDFGKGAKTFIANVASATNGGQIEIRLGGVNGELIGVCDIQNTGDSHNWKTYSTKIKKAKGIHDIYFVFKGAEGELFNFDWWQLK